MSELWPDGILDQNRYGRPRPRERTGTDSLCGRFSCSHRWVPFRMASQTNGLPQSGFVDDRRCCRVRGSVHARLVDRRRHASSASRRKPTLGTAGFPSCLLATSTRRTLHLCEVLSPCPARGAREGLSHTYRSIHMMYGNGVSDSLARPARDQLDSQIAVIYASGMKPRSHPGLNLGIAFVSEEAFLRHPRLSFNVRQE